MSGDPAALLTSHRPNAPSSLPRVESCSRSKASAARQQAPASARGAPVSAKSTAPTRSLWASGKVASRLSSVMPHTSGHHQRGLNHHLPLFLVARPLNAVSHAIHAVLDAVSPPFLSGRSPWEGLWACGCSKREAGARD